jgi:hypothetical protein
MRAVADAEAGVTVDTQKHVTLDQSLDSHPELVRGRLDNGFEYVILPNKSPPTFFEAHLQVWGTLFPFLCHSKSGGCSLVTKCAST